MGLFGPVEFVQLKGLSRYWVALYGITTIVVSKKKGVLQGHAQDYEMYWLRGDDGKIRRYSAEDLCILMKNPDMRMRVLNN